MPTLGEGDTEITVTRWLKKEGDHVRANEPLFAIFTGKVDTEAPSPATGLLFAITVAEGETVTVLTRLAVIVPDRDMRARPNLSGSQLVQDYMARVAAAARHLPKGARMAFVGRTKAQIDRQVTAAGTDDPGKVVEILAGFGEPEELVRAERLRIDSKRLKKRGRDGDSVSDTAATPV